MGERRDNLKADFCVFQSVFRQIGPNRVFDLRNTDLQNIGLAAAHKLNLRAAPDLNNLKLLDRFLFF